MKGLHLEITDIKNGKSDSYWIFMFQNLGHDRNNNNSQIVNNMFAFDDVEFEDYLRCPWKETCQTKNLKIPDKAMGKREWGKPKGVRIKKNKLNVWMAVWKAFRIRN